jgi:hypothetical protein
MYTPAAIAIRRCTAMTRAGHRCRGWATWEGERQLCGVHRGLTRGPRPYLGGWKTPGGGGGDHPARYVPCRCSQIPYPHRPGGGACRWPESS